MTRRKSTRESASTDHHADDLRSWEKQPAPEMVRTMTSDDDELDEVFSDFPQNEACIELFRVNAQGGRPAFLEQLSPVEFSLAYVKEKHGGGRYQAKGKYKDGSKVRMPFEIEGEPIVVKRPPAPLASDTPVLPAAPAANPSAAPVALTGNGLETALLGMMRQLIAETRSSEMQILEKMRVYKELFGGPTQKDAPLEQVLAMFKQGIELGSTAGGGEGPNLWMLALDKLKEPLTKIVETINYAVTAPPRTAIAGPAAIPAQPSASPAPVESDPMLGLLKMVLPSLVNGAAKNSDPSVYVEWLLDQVPTSAYASLRDWLMKPDCLDAIAKIEPGIRFQAEWWTELRGLLIDAINEALGHGSRPVQSEQAGESATGAPTDSPVLS